MSNHSTSSRQDILANIRSSLDVGTRSTISNDLRMKNAVRRIQSHPKGIVPQGSSFELFCKKVVASEASLQCVKSYAKAHKAISKYLRAHNLPAQLKIGTDKRLAKIRSAIDGDLEFSIGPSDGSDLVCLSHAQCGVAETGTLILTSGPQNPSTLNFLPDTHIIIIDKKDIEGSYEHVWEKIRQKFGQGKMPRTLNMITGPSRSADIEQTLILGAHGPLRLHVIVIDKGK